MFHTREPVKLVRILSCRVCDCAVSEGGGGISSILVSQKGFKCYGILLYFNLTVVWFESLKGRKPFGKSRCTLEL